MYEGSCVLELDRVRVRVRVYEGSCRVRVRVRVYEGSINSVVRDNYEGR